MPLDMKALGGWVARSRAADAPVPPNPPRKGGIDFAEISRRLYEEATPERRARMDARAAEEARVAETASEIPAVFERREFRPERDGRGMRASYVAETWTRNVGLQIEGEPGAEILRFTRAVTGHEAYRLDEEFCRLLEDPEENRMRPRFYICAGTPGRWHGCSVEPADVAAYLRERRPEMFPGGPTP